MKECRITVVGTGYVGLVTAACLAEIGHRVMALDIDERKINVLKDGKVPIYEPGLEDLVRKNLGTRLCFTTSYDEAVPWADVAFIAVGTPDNGDGDAELKYVRDAADSLLPRINKPTIVVVKSTVPVGLCDELQDHLRDGLSERVGPGGRDLVSVVSNPEFLREGKAVPDFMQADRVVIGGDDKNAISIVKDLYEPLGVPFVICDRRSSELIKYASNAFLATKVSFINSVAHLCERLGADVTKVAEGMGYDHRIMPEHLRAGLGYGGSCFPKDTAALLNASRRAGYRFKILEATARVNEGQIDWVIEILENELGPLEGKTIAVWGIAFKPNTDDTRDSQAVRLIHRLLQKQAFVRAYDPVAALEVGAGAERFVLCKDKYQAASGSEALVIATEWNEFIDGDFLKVKSLMESPLCVDTRNCLEKDHVAGLGFIYTGLGRNNETA